MWLEPITLEGDHVCLEPLTAAHLPELQRAADETDATPLWYASLPSAETMPGYLEKALAGMQQGNIAFAVRMKSTGQVVGCTRYYDVAPAHRRALIGYTWYSLAARRTAVNTEAKYLLLKHLFEQKDAIAVEFRTHFFNRASRAAIERLGAKQDGILRSHQRLPDGSLRDTVVYSIIAAEWPAVRNNLQAKLNSIEGRIT